MESGYDIAQGGARYNHVTLGTQALGSVVNSLAAIRWAVFEEKLLTMEELVEHLRNNFAGAEDVRQMLLRKAPKYGNDDPRTDELAQWVMEVLEKTVRSHRSPVLGGPYRPIDVGNQVIEGFLCGLRRTELASRRYLTDIPANGTELNGARGNAFGGQGLQGSYEHQFHLQYDHVTFIFKSRASKFTSMLLAYFLGEAGRFRSIP